MLNTSARRSLRRMGALALLFLAGLLPLTWATTNAATIGEQRTAVILVNFQDDVSQPLSVADAHAMVFGTVSDLMWEASYQKTFLSGDVFGWFTIPVSRAVCDVNLFAVEADKLAIAAGVRLADYQRLVYLLPQNACSGAGSNSGPSTPSRLWVTSNNHTPQMIAHELGHNFGLLHAQALECGSASYGSDCAVQNYGDPADTMGSGYVTHFNAAFKEKIGWLNANGAPAITTVTASGSYAIAPMSAATGGVRALRIPRGTDPASGEMSYYYLEYRQPTGFDATLATTGNLTKGVLVHVGGVNQTNVLLDMTPGSLASSTFADMSDAALAPGRSYSDAAAGISFTVKSADAGGALVDVTVAGQAATCTRAAPAVALGAGASATAGSRIDYAGTLRNLDSAGCGATTFMLAANVPAGWSGSVPAASVTLSPGASAGVGLGVTSAAGAAAGTYGVGLGVASSAGGVHTAGAGSTYTVTPSSSVLPLTSAVGTDKSTYAKGEVAYISVRVLRDGTPVAGATVRTTVTLPNGSRTGLSATSGSDGYARHSLKLGKGKSAVGGYALQSEATLSGATAAATGGFVVR